MKLRNKKTGDIIVGKCFTDIIEVLGKRGDFIVRPTLLNLDLFTKYWEEVCDYEPKEPLIKDEKIREIIRTWMLANDVSELTYIVDENSLQDIFRNSISFNRVLDLKDGEHYTIEELCGEEEE